MADSASETAQNAYEQTREFAGDVVEGARNNAIPAAMIGVGLAWLLVDRFRRNDRSGDYRRRRSSSARTPEYYGSEDYYRSARRARNQFQRLLTENPLMIGAAAAVVGCAVGMALPETERENEWLGETRDNVVEKAQDAARNVATRAQEAVGEAAGDVTKKVVSGKE